MTKPEIIGIIEYESGEKRVIDIADFTVCRSYEENGKTLFTIQLNGVERKTVNNRTRNMRHIEENLQMLCVEWFEMQYPGIAEDLHHSPNGGKRNAREAARFKRMGTKPGYPDLFLSIPMRKNFRTTECWHGLYIEMKSPDGTTSEKQKRMQERLKKKGLLRKNMQDD